MAKKGLNDMPRKRKKKRRAKTQLETGDYLDQEQVQYILTLLKKAADDGGYRTAKRLFVFRLLVNTGLRRGEAASLQIRDLPCSHGKHQVAIRWEVTKSRRNRGVVVNESFRKVLDEFVDRFCDKGKSKSPLLRNEYGNQMTGQNIYCLIKTIGRMTGIGGIRPHMLRHTYLSLLYSIDKDQMFVKDQGGHSDIKTTNIYVHIGDNERERQVSKLNWLST